MRSRRSPRGRDARRGAIESQVDFLEQLAVSVLLVVGECFFARRDRVDEVVYHLWISERFCKASIAELLKISPIHHLLELSAHWYREHRFVEVDGFAHQCESAAGDDRTCRREIFDEPRLAE